MILLRILSVGLGAVTTVSILVLARFVVGIPLLTALGGRAAVPGPELPLTAVAAALVVAALGGGAVTAWTAPDRPLVHALALAAAGGGALAAVAVFGPPGAPRPVLSVVFAAAVVLGAWVPARLAGREDRPPPVKRTGTGGEDG